jgi:hypothetical protein
MIQSIPRVISASRRTDIPAFYMDWFMQQIRQGYFEVQNPYNQRISRISSLPEDVHTLVFWSKNYARFLHGGYADQLISAGYRLFFNFTVNSESGLLEPHVSPLSERLNQMIQLGRLVDPRCITWRFDPICVYRNANGDETDNMNDFLRIADVAASAEITTCIVSFLDIYAKVRKRADAAGIQFIDPSPDRQIEILTGLENILDTRHIRLYTCCEKEVLNLMPRESRIQKSSCVPNHHLLEIYGGNISLQADTGQRIKQGCGCRVSTDIGSYRIHPCYHNCLFCYANPAPLSGINE